MNIVRPPLHHRLAALMLSLASGPVTCFAVDQSLPDATVAPEVPVARTAVPGEPLRVGDATAGLLALQREGRAASPVPRPIPGEVAQRSYQRYLRSFEYPIPERYGSSTTGGGGGVGSGGAGR